MHSVVSGGKCKGYLVRVSQAFSGVIRRPGRHTVSVGTLVEGAGQPISGQGGGLHVMLGSGDCCSCAVQELTESSRSWTVAVAVAVYVSHQGKDDCG